MKTKKAIPTLKKNYIYVPAEVVPSHSFRKDFGIVGCIMSGILLGLMVLALLSSESGLPKVRDVLLIKRQIERDIEQLQAENEQLLQKIDAVKTDLFWQEKIAREELNMALPGEIIYKFAE